MTDVFLGDVESACLRRSHGFLLRSDKIPSASQSFTLRSDNQALAESANVIWYPATFSHDKCSPFNVNIQTMDGKSSTPILQ